MKKVLLIFVLLIGGAMALLYFSNPSSSFGSSLPISNEDTRLLTKQSINFLEDLQFKDFEKAATYHSTEDRKNVDIAEEIERIFLVKPEFLDIMRYEIKKVEIDRSGDRAKVKTHTVIKLLNTGQVKEPEVMLYWHKDPKEGWVMKLRSSL